MSAILGFNLYKCSLCISSENKSAQHYCATHFKN